MRKITQQLLEQEHRTRLGQPLCIRESTHYIVTLRQSSSIDFVRTAPPRLAETLKIGKESHRRIRLVQPSTNRPHPRVEARPTTPEDEKCPRPKETLQERDGQDGSTRILANWYIH